MRLYLDHQYPASFVNIIKSIHELQYPKEYEIISGDWLNDNNADETIVFLVDTSKRGLDAHALNYYKDGFRVFAFRKPYDKPYNLFKQTLIFLSQWNKILNTIRLETKPFIYTISEAKTPMTKYNVEGLL
jgi:hypothetical protein